MIRGFGYEGGGLRFAGWDLQRLVERFATPLYVYAESILLENARRWQVAMREAFGGRGQVAYAVKANDRLQVLRCLAGLGCGGDVVSEGEVQRACAAGIAPSKIVFSGVGKSDAALEEALSRGITKINVESESELLRLGSLSRRLGVEASVALRVNPDIEAGTHRKISTGGKYDKFGIPPEQARELYRRSIEGIRFEGIAVHIGSQIVSLAPFRQSFAFLAEWAGLLEGDKLSLKRLDLGGGIGVDGKGEPSPSPSDYAHAASKILCSVAREAEIFVQPGRSIAASAGLLLARILVVKRVAERSCAVLDAGMSDFMRSALYDATHDILPLAEQDMQGRDSVWFVGPLCESADAFGVQAARRSPREGAGVAVTLTGAYGAVMANRYNARALPMEIMLAEEGVRIVSARRGEEREIEQERSMLQDLA